MKLSSELGAHVRGFTTTTILAVSLLLGCSEDEQEPATDLGQPDLDANIPPPDTGMTRDMRTRDLGVGGEDANPPDLTGVDAFTDAAADAAEVGGDMGGSVCTKEPNAGSPPTDTCQHGAADWLAWEWVPDEDVAISEIQMHTDDGFAALFADDMSRPGTVLAQGALSTPDADGWRTLIVDPPVQVMGGTTYWLGEDVLTCSTVEDGVEFTYFTSNSTAGPWSGPFTAHPFTARINGTCP